MYVGQKPSPANLAISRSDLTLDSPYGVTGLSAPVSSSIVSPAWP